MDIRKGFEEKSRLGRLLVNRGYLSSLQLEEGLRLQQETFVPVLNFLDSDLTITGVHYRDDGPRHHLDGNGRLMLAFPERIEEIRMDNIRVSGGRTPPLGNVSISNIRFDPASRMTIYTK